ncbi:TetR/AcrR family transcriptional regulator [Nocardia cyriacigeorgica]|uniref:TetR/AcrR family transcriptional regulator n=1 Tax=Nocardia cyriacigeorgica TaxID=135487 RepID=UPI00189482B4|nr:TetR/AcrR family transcriptional regulator [Nocardia cyriacigeorgica]MBF6345360.1 TetR/AcrR family transcriptional regulator [Nocardia cyriacigeorgica]
MAKAKNAGGRPREHRVDLSIAEAVRQVVGEAGYAGLTVDAVAARAGVSKAAIYRRYSTKQEMTFAVLLHDTEEQPPADTGTLHGDLVALTEQIAAQLVGSGADTLSGLLADIRADPELRDRFATGYLSVERGIITTVLERARARGELARLPDPVIVQSLLLGPLFAWLIVLDEDAAQLAELVRLIATSAADALIAGRVPADIGAR